jgi:tRNA pseudouridine55 synthase
VGQATRLIQYVQQMPKTYCATFLLGKRSETDDVEAELEDVPAAIAPTLSRVDAALADFVGEIDQRPPAHSAVKIGGKRAYELARRGARLDLQPRKVQVHRIQQLEYDYPNLKLEIECGSGTYVRSIGRDLGEMLGTGAVMADLVRTAIGNFHLEDALPAAEILPETISRDLQPAHVALSSLPRATLSAAQLIEIRNGRPILDAWLTRSNEPATSSAELAALDATGRLVAILQEKRPGELWPRINFSRTSTTN